MSDFVRFIVKCVQTHRDGNTDPSEAKIGEILDVTEMQWTRLRQSAPDSFELIERRVPRPVEEEIFDTAVPMPKRKPRAPKKAAAQDAKS